LLKEKRDVSSDTLIPDSSYPYRVHRPVTRPTFSTHNDPVDTIKWKGFDWSKERFNRQEPDDGWNVPKMIDTPSIVGIFYRNALPHIGWPRKLRSEVCQSLSSLG